MKRKGSAFIQFRQRIPSDVLERARGRDLWLPIGDRQVRKRISGAADTVVISLQTRDPAEAKARHHDVAGYLGTVWRALRDDAPVALTQRLATALAGKYYFAQASDERAVSAGVVYMGELRPS